MAKYWDDDPRFRSIHRLEVGLVLRLAINIPAVGSALLMGWILTLFLIIANQI